MENAEAYENGLASAPYAYNNIPLWALECKNPRDGLWLILSEFDANEVLPLSYTVKRPVDFSILIDRQLPAESTSEQFFSRLEAKGYAAIKTSPNIVFKSAGGVILRMSDGTPYARLTGLLSINIGTSELIIEIKHSWVMLVDYSWASPSIDGTTVKSFESRGILTFTKPSIIIDVTPAAVSRSTHVLSFFSSSPAVMAKRMSLTSARKGKKPSGN